MAKNGGATVGRGNVRQSIGSMNNREIRAAIGFGGLGSRATNRLRRELQSRLESGVDRA